LCTLCRDATHIITALRWAQLLDKASLYSDTNHYTNIDSPQSSYSNGNNSSNGQEEKADDNVNFNQLNIGGTSQKRSGQRSHNVSSAAAGGGSSSAAGTAAGNESDANADDDSTDGNGYGGALGREVAKENGRYAIQIEL
jgi:hypothetical protein